MKKLIALLLALSMVACLFVGCAPANDDGTAGYDYDAIPDTMESEDGKYPIAFVTDVGQLKDKSFNQGTWEGTKRYAKENNKAYKYYMPANGDNATDDDRYNAMKAAVDGGAEVVICAGFLQGTALAKAAAEFTDVKFVFIDGSVLTDSENKALTNVMSIDFQEEQSGYLAGYAAVMEGYTKLGFSGGGGGTNPACCRFGFGFVQGAQAAAAEKGINVEMKYSFAYGGSYQPSPELQTQLSGWYNNGTEVIFVCGGSMCKSAFAAAAEIEGKKVIGVDVDQSAESETVVTSATKGLREAVMYACEQVYGEKWDEVGGKLTTMGASKNAVGLPTDTWSMKNFSVEQYNELFAKLVDGTVVVDKDYENNFKTEYSNLTLTVEE